LLRDGKPVVRDAQIRRRLVGSVTTASSSGTDGYAGHHRYSVMSNQLKPKTDPSQPMVYQIRIKGHLGRRWTDWFGGLSITLEDNGETLLTGPVVDQAALHGLLRKVRDLGLPLLSVTHIRSGQADASDLK
jgi:hypothetical protein